MVSLRAIAGCIGVSGSFSVVRDFFGYRHLDPPFGPRLSILSQIRLLQGSHVHLNFIQVGQEYFTLDVEKRIDGALVDLRRIYAAVQVGVGRVEYYAIGVEDAGGAEIITDHDEGLQLMGEWSVPNNGIDVFLVVDAEGLRGFSPIGGPCDKDDKKSGVVLEAVGLNGYYPFVGRSAAHEVGHYLGLPHRDVKGNLMHTNEYDMGESLASDQAAAMRGHCMMQSGCL